ncbi:MAG TPA: VOC family protein [Casimicrobiaceae bacterium]|nr:VOC family protein [Casimicrobiaceae bacterium]
MIRLHDIRYVRLGTTDLAAGARYATSILGLEEVGATSDSRYFKSDHRDHTLVFVHGDPAKQCAGFDLEEGGDLDAVAREIDAQNLPVRYGTCEECELRRVDRFLEFKDPSGNTIDLVVGARACDRNYAASRDAGITGFSHIGLRTTNAPRDEAFWTRICNARVSDRIGAAPLLRIDAVHHKIALFPSMYPGVQHVNHQVGDINDVMRAYYFLRERDVRIVFGPGRHPTSSAIFLYFEGPDGMVYEYSTGVRMIDDEASYVPRQFPFAPDSFCLWGSRPDIAEFRENR